MSDKTRVIIASDVHQEKAKAGDCGYIDGYVSGADNRPCAVFVEDNYGNFSLVPLHQLMAEEPVQ